VNEVLAGRDGRTAVVTDPAQHRNQVTGGRAGLQGGVQAVSVAAGCQRPGEQVRPSAGAGAKARLGVVQPEQVG
jgi:hypothetical protein